MIEQAVTEAFAKLTKRASTRSEVLPRHTIPIRQAPERQGIMVKVADLADEADSASLLAKYLRSYLNHDEQAMRGIARELATV